jgi:hypothetical protein
LIAPIGPPAGFRPAAFRPGRARENHPVSRAKTTQVFSRRKDVVNPRAPLVFIFPRKLFAVSFLVALIA